MNVHQTEYFWTGVALLSSQTVMVFVVTAVLSRALRFAMMATTIPRTA
jgi:hypothetical protein